MKRYSAYPEYRSSGIDWADVLPGHWNTAKLKWYSICYTGGTPDKNNDSFWDDGTIPWLNSGAVNDRYITGPSAYITEDAYKNSSAKWVSEGALLMALAGQGKTKGMVARLGFRSTCNQSLAAIIPDSRLLPGFLYWWLTKNYTNIRNLGGGDNRDGINLDMLGGISVPLPSSEEQQAIAAFLDRETAKIDGVIGKREKLIELLQEKRSALISHAVTKGLDPEVKLKPSGIDWLGDIPEHWEMWKIAHGYSQTGSGTTPPSEEDVWYDGDICWVTTGELRENIILDTSKKITSEALQTFSALKLFPPGTLLVAMYGATIGRLAILGINATTNQACCALVNSSIFETRFVFYWFQAFKEFVILLASGGGQPNISQDKIRSLKIASPSFQEQQMIAEYLDKETAKIDSLIEKEQTIIGKLKEYRLALISEAVTGKIDVRETA